MKKEKFLALSIFLPMILASCVSNETSTSSISTSSSSETPFSITQPGEATSSSSSSSSESSSSSTSSEESSSSEEPSSVSERAGYSKWTYSYVDQQAETYIIPSVGSPKILVVPVQFNDLSEKWNNERLSNLNIALNGNDGAGGATSYWESAASFYAKSSYGLFTPSFVVTDVVTPKLTANYFVNAEARSDGAGMDYLINTSYSDITVGGERIKTEDYDINSDGYIDGIFFIHNEFDMNYINSTKNFWAYVYYYNDSEDIPVNVYGNMGAGFFYSESEEGYDTHTFIHEFGHEIGLDDYYCNDSGVKYSASGGLLMMEYNIGDHDAFSKYSVGWINPYLAVKGSKVTLNSFESTGDALILPSGYWNGSAFSEYYIIDFYHKEGLAELDATTKYETRPLYFKENGIRVYHIDARLGKITYNLRKSEEKLSSYLSPDATTIPKYSSSRMSETWYTVASNNSVYTRSYNGKSLISYIPSDNSSVYNHELASDELNWKEGSTISATSTSKSLTSGNWNSGASFDWEVHVDSITDEQAVLTIN